MKNNKNDNQPIYTEFAQNDWKSLLKKLKHEHLKATAPGFWEASGRYAYKMPNYTDATANGLTKCIEDFVKFQGGYANRISTTGTMRKINGQMKWTRGNSNKGAADLRILHQGRSFDIEIKIGRDRQSEAQRKEQERIVKAGGTYMIVRSFPEFLQHWQSWGFNVVP